MRLATGMLTLLPLLVSAETAYVTDTLRLEVRAAPSQSERPFRVIESGTEVDVVGREGFYARVVLADGVQGYVSAGYLVSDKPAALIVAETQAESERLAAELAELRQSFAEPAAVIDGLRAEVAAMESRISSGAARIDELEEENSAYRRRAENARYALPLPWVASATLLCLIGGFLLGLWWVDHRSRKRHGGIRIY